MPKINNHPNSQVVFVALEHNRLMTLEPKNEKLSVSQLKSFKEVAKEINQSSKTAFKTKEQLIQTINNNGKKKKRPIFIIKLLLSRDKITATNKDGIYKIHSIKSNDIKSCRAASNSAIENRITFGFYNQTCQLETWGKILNPESTSLMERIKLSTQQAQEKYCKYHENNDDLYNRGSHSGFFSWLRHGQKGIIRAKLYNRHAQNLNDVSGFKTLLRDILMKPSSRYHCHSFSSYLLDELSTVFKGSIPLNRQSNRYNKNLVWTKIEEEIKGLEKSPPSHNPNFS